MVSDEEMETDILPAEVIQKLPELMPEINPAEFKEGLRVSDLPLLFTVYSMVYAVALALKKEKDMEIET